MVLKERERHFPGRPVVKTPCFHCRGHGFHPCRGVKVLDLAVQCSQRVKKRERVCVILNESKIGILGPSWWPSG